MTIDPVKIPQNVQIEDRIIGPVTLRQLIITVIGCGISYVIWSSLERAYGQLHGAVIVATWIPALIFAAFAFMRVYDMTLLRFFMLVMRGLTHPATRLWAPRVGMSMRSPHARVETPEKKKPAKAEQSKELSIEEVSSALDVDPQEVPLASPAHRNVAPSASSLLSP